MLGSYSMNFILLYMICGFSAAFINLYLFKWYFLGHTFGAVTIGIIGSFLGALLSTMIFHEGISPFSIVISVIVAFSALYFFHLVSRHHPD